MSKSSNKLFDTAIISKRNVLNELRKNNMTLQELRFFSIYLSKINSRNISTRVVRFPLSDFQKIMEIGSDMNINHFRMVIRKLLQQIVEVPNDSGYGYTAFQLFKECSLKKNENEEWYVEIDAHDKALPLMFDFKNKYFSYELWNALRLKSSNQIRMYEILKQYENLGKRELTVTELRELLGIEQNEYDRWDNFKRKVLDSCQEALLENTDICFTYKRGKVGKGGKWITIIFYISKNIKHKNKLSLDEFIKMQPIPPELPDDRKYSNERIAFLAGACNYEFSDEEMIQILEVVGVVDEAKLPVNVPVDDINLRMYHYLAERYAALNVEASKKTIKRRFAYFIAMLKSDV